MDQGVPKIIPSREFQVSTLGTPLDSSVTLGRIGARGESVPISWAAAEQGGNNAVMISKVSSMAPFSS